MRIVLAVLLLSISFVLGVGYEKSRLSDTSEVQYYIEWAKRGHTPPGWYSGHIGTKEVTVNGQSVSLESWDLEWLTKYDKVLEIMERIEQLRGFP